MRISLIGGPGSGKTTTASRLFADLKAKQYDIELVGEYIKKWAYKKRSPTSYDQVYIFGQQLHAEDLVFQSGVDHLITDSPLVMQPFYGKEYHFSAWAELLAIAKRYEETHPSITILLDRTGVPYKQKGRYESPAEAAGRDANLKIYLEQQNIPFTTFKSIQYHAILDHVENCLSRHRGNA